ncbi:MAG: single-stranded DNA-binding protein [Planctomycetota bacterium]
MASFNRVIIMGNLTRDIELRYTPGGLAVSELAVAVNDRRKTAEGQWVDEASFFDVTLFGRTAEVASEYLSKGSSVMIEGRLKQDRWEKDGVKRSKVHIIGERMQMLGGRGESGGNRSSGGGSFSDNAAATSSTSSQSSQVVAEQTPAADRGSTASTGPSGTGSGYDEPDIPF